MAFGPIMRFTLTDSTIVELAPLNKEVMGEFVSPGMQQGSITRYLLRRNAPVLEDEHEWFDRVRQQTDALTWGIWVVENDERKLIGSSGLHNIEYRQVAHATSGSMIFDSSYWGRGIASGAHKARTWYGFTQLGFHCIKSAVAFPNIGSRKALEKSGYHVVSTERNVSFVDGQLQHQYNLECINPASLAWRVWWGDDRPTKAALEARQRTLASLEWAAKNVEMP